MSLHEGKKAVITGGTTGIGLAVAKAILGGGGEVLLTGRNEQTLEAARRELGSGAHVVRSDAGRLSDVEALGAIVEETLGHFDFLFLNAGISKPATLDRVTEGLYDETFDVNVKGPYFTAKRLAPLLRDGGAVVLNTSVASVKGIPETSVYAASKAALRSVTRTLAGELLARRIRVNAVSPGPIETPINGKFGLTAEERVVFEREVAASNPMKRFGTTEEVSRAVLFLAFEATYTTGAELPIDGGFTQL